MKMNSLTMAKTTFCSKTLKTLARFSPRRVVLVRQGGCAALALRICLAAKWFAIVVTLPFLYSTGCPIRPVSKKKQPMSHRGTSSHLVLNAPPASTKAKRGHRGVLRKVFHANMCISVALEHTQPTEIDRLKGQTFLTASRAGISFYRL